MLSFYHLPSTIVRHPVHKILKVAYAFYNVSFTVPLKDLLLDSLILEKKVCCWYWYNSSDSNLANIGTMLPGMKQGSISTAANTKAVTGNS